MACNKQWQCHQMIMTNEMAKEIQPRKAMKRSNQQWKHQRKMTNQWKYNININNILINDKNVIINNEIK